MAASSALFDGGITVGRNFFLRKDDVNGDVQPIWEVGATVVGWEVNCGPNPRGILVFVLVVIFRGSALGDVDAISV
jgi:hypothetical protein